MNLFVAIASLLVAHAVDGASLHLAHPYGELVDTGAVTAFISTTADDRFDCSAPIDVARKDRTITVTVRALAPGGPAPQCVAPPEVSLGELAAGWWTTVLRLVEAAGPVIEEARSEWLVGRPNAQCGAHPVLRGSVLVTHTTMSSAQLAARIAQDAAFAARMLNPSEVRTSDTFATLYYQPLDNPHDQRATLQATGEFASVSANGLLCFSASPPDAFGSAVEFFHAGLGHYFYAIDENEIAGLDGGTGAKGWARTGHGFRVLVAPGCAASARESIAYRFFGKPGVGPSSHVFTVDRQECRTVDRSGAWIYEGSPFWATPPNASGGCTHTDEIELHRLWKPFGESNHRFATDLAIVEEMKAKGWTHEGVAMCVKKPG